MILRIGAGLTLLYLHGWGQAAGVWNHLWNGAEWDLIATLEKAEMPLPKILAIVSAVVTAFTAGAWIFGFATRFASFILLPVMLVALLVANRTGIGASAETCVLYFFIAICLTITGPGWLALDALFKSRKSKKSGGYI